MARHDVNPEKFKGQFKFHIIITYFRIAFFIHYWNDSATRKLFKTNLIQLKISRIKIEYII